jgi:aryl-alcohol dehydrogenase-like predicted oxidoreductase
MTAVPTIALRPGYDIARVIRGGWQLAGGHGAVDRDAAADDLAAAVEAGLFTFDCADIYTGVEALIGEARRRVAARAGAAAAARIRVHTKLVPDLAILARVDRAYVRGIVEQSLRRLGQDRLDLVQFHWWDYAVPGFLDALGWLRDLRDEGKLRHIGGTNFDTAHTRAIVDAGIPLVSMQVQYSLLDRRPEEALVPYALGADVALLCYGTVAGGFLSDAWLGRPEPAGPLENRSLTKYRLIIEDFGGWARFQALLAVLRRIADRHGTDIATVASRAVLDRPAVAAVIVGARNRAHIEKNLAIGALALTDADRSEIAAVIEPRLGPAGDTYALERDRGGRHGSIIKYNLNAGETVPAG